MARKKVKLAWITNDSTRRATFKKRKKGLLKKAHELSTLCDVNTCVVVYGPQEREAEAWPSAAESQCLLQCFRNMPEMEQSKKMVDQEGFLRSRLSKITEQLRRLERENRELDTCLLMHDTISGQQNIPGVSMDEATTLAWMVDIRLKTIQDRMHQLRTSADPSHSHNLALQLPGPSTPAPSLGQSLNQGYMLPISVQLQPPQMHPQAAPNANTVQAGTCEMIACYPNLAESFGFGHTNETVSMQTYADASTAWNNYLRQN